jgi:hypothetical protein
MPDGGPDWLVPPALPEGATVELTTHIKAGGLTPQVFELLARIARDAEVSVQADERVAGAGCPARTSCPNLTHCGTYHDHGQPCPNLQQCTVNTFVVEPEVVSE